MIELRHWTVIFALGFVAMATTACPQDEPDSSNDTVSEQVSDSDTESASNDDGTESTSDSETTASSSDSGTDSGSDTGAAELSCEDLAEGANVGFVVGSLKRTVTLNFPNNVESGGPWPVIFGWHGVGDTDENFSGFMSGLVNSPDYPFISVTPDDRNLIPPVGFEWAYFKAGQANAEIELFDAIVNCLDERFGVDRERIHTFGLSGGAIMSDFLAVLRGDELASVVTYSGGYFSNPDNPSSALIKGLFSWPEATPASYAQLLVHGGPTDSYSLVLDTIHFDQMTLADVPYLNGLGHDLLLCNHNLGHPVIPAEIWSNEAVEFFADHPRTAVETPYATALPDWVPDYCELHLKTE